MEVPNFACRISDADSLPLTLANLNDILSQNKLIS